MKCKTNTKLITLILAGGIAHRMVFLLKYHETISTGYPYHALCRHVA
jgi:hypothetical protein